VRGCAGLGRRAGESGDVLVGRCAWKRGDPHIVEFVKWRVRERSRRGMK
jgi:hypothetical protein